MNTQDVEENTELEIGDMELETGEGRLEEVNSR